jgi:Holliday junction DNA helicase RuvA
MIGCIEGVVAAKKAGFVILMAGGVGYKIAGTRDTLAKLKEKENAFLWTYLAVREGALDLYGFNDEEAMHFFELLLTVPGIGPKSALAILDIADVDTLRSAIVAGNAGYLTKVSGIGKKTAEKIVLELRDKVGNTTADSSRVLSGDEEALEAMRTLGYTHNEAREALRKVPAQIEGGSARLREALRLLGSR